MKKVILIKHSEITPEDSKSPRYLRTGQMYFHYSDKKIPCTWITSTFNHFQKKQRFNKSKIINTHNSSNILYLSSRGYKKNISITRLIDHFTWGFKVFHYLIKNRKSIDFIITSMPTIFSTFLTIIVSKYYKINAVVEVRDKWPDIFWSSQKNKKTKIIIKTISYPLKLMVNWSIRNCYICTVPSESYRDWVIKNNKNISQSKIVTSYLGYKKDTFSNDPSQNTLLQSIRNDTQNKKIICFAGTIGHMFDLETIVKAANDPSLNDEFFFVMLGNGDTLEFWKNQTKNSSNIKFYGWADKESIHAILSLSFLGLAPYINNDNFNGHIPNKIMEYCAYGLPIVSSLQGYVDSFLKENQFGSTFINNDIESLISSIKESSFYIEKNNNIKNEMINFFEKNFKAELIYDQIYNLLHKS